MIYLSSIIIDVIFGVWSAIGKAWYWYPLNIILLFIASSMINTSFIQLLTRTYAVFALKAPRAFSQILGLVVLTIEPAHKLKIDQNKLQNCRSNILNLVNVL
ncbi:hypothetical protein D1AOALGA4SA_6120 [Olavius algarvensis Delta 1 endosymbiont]|nr:hypothetical protein D1AOALGA4SA_6120 [Olavius algarvensis Delta 1 endosymbiont]